MNARHRSSIQREISERMFQLEELKNLLEVFGQDDLSLSSESAISGLEIGGKFV